MDKVSIKESPINYINDNEVIFFKNKTTAEIATHLVERLKLIDKKEKILYIYSHTTQQQLFNDIDKIENKTIFVCKDNIDIDSLEKILINNNNHYICINYLKLYDNKKRLSIEKQKLKYVLDILENYKNRYKVIFIVAVNWKK